MPAYPWAGLQQLAADENPEVRGVFEAAERVGAGPLVRTGNAALVFASRFFQLQSLYRATARYRPRWEPRYLLYDTNFAIPRIAVAALMAEGFLPFGGPGPTRPFARQPSPPRWATRSGATRRTA